MRSITFAFLGPEPDAARLAKRGTASDITLYNGKQGDAHLNLVHPTRFPEKVQSLAMALDIADGIILQPAQLDRAFGESVVGASLFGKTSGFLRVTPPLSPDQVLPLLENTPLASLEVSADPEGRFRERLYERALAGGPGPAVIPVDHAFPVKGVGTVVLGLVRSGEVSAHQSLQAYPSDRVVEARSVQVHDVDVPVAPARSRVGLAVKGAEAAEVPRGTVLASPGSLQVAAAGTRTRLRLEPSPFSKWRPREGAVAHLFHVLQDVEFRVDSVEDPVLSGRLGAPLAVVPDQPLVLADLDSPSQRFIGRASIA